MAETWAQNGPNHEKAVAKQACEAFGHLRPGQLNDLIVSPMLSRWRTDYARSTVYTYRQKLKSLLSTLEQFGAPRINLPRVAAPPQRVVTATHDELVRLLKDPAPWLRLFMLLYFQCGLRFAEALRVTPRTWNRDQHTCTVPIKGGRSRTANLTPDVELLLASAGDPDADMPFIFALRGRRMNPKTIRAQWWHHKRKCGVSPEVTAHDLRRTAVKIIYHNTKDLRIAQQLLGHQRLASTLSYLTPLAPEETRQYQELLHFEHFQSDVKQ